MSLAVNVFSMIASFIGMSKGTYAKAEVPGWVLIFNIAMMIFEIVYLVLNPDML